MKLKIKKYIINYQLLLIFKIKNFFRYGKTMYIKILRDC